MMSGLLMKREFGRLLAYWRVMLFHHLMTVNLHVESVSIPTLLRKSLQFLVAILSALHAGQVISAQPLMMARDV
jgi:hypothetical protein